MLVILWLVIRPDTAIGRILNTRSVAHIGVLSYSLYLWQQLFTFDHSWLSIPVTLLAAEFSFHAIERPFLRLRDQVLKPKMAVLPLQQVATT